MPKPKIIFTITKIFLPTKKQIKVKNSRRAFWKRSCWWNHISKIYNKHNSSARIFSRPEYYCIARCTVKEFIVYQFYLLFLRFLSKCIFSERKYTKTFIMRFKTTAEESHLCKTEISKVSSVYQISKHQHADKTAYQSLEITSLCGVVLYWWSIQNKTVT